MPQPPHLSDDIALPEAHYAAMGRVVESLLSKWFPISGLVSLDTYLRNPQEFEVLLNHFLSFSSRQEPEKNAFREVDGLKRRRLILGFVRQARKALGDIVSLWKPRVGAHNQVLR
jgi:hypothetical protein